MANVAARRPRPTLALLGWVAFVLLVYAVLLGGGYGGIYFVSLRLLSLSLITAVLAVWAHPCLARPAWRPATAIWPAFVTPLASFALSTTLSAFPRQGLEYVAWAVLVTALYLLLARILASHFARVRIGGLAAALGLALGLLYLGVVVGRWLEWWELLGRLAAPPLRPVFAGLTFGNPSAVLTAQVLLTVVACAGLGFGTRARGRSAWLL